MRKAQRVVPKRDESIALGTLVQEALEAELGQPLAWPEEAKRTIERIALDAEWTLDGWTQALLPLATEDRLDPAAIERALQRNQPENVSTLFALPLKEAREAFERLYLERLLARTDLPVQRLADLAGLERTHFYRKLRQLGLSLRRKEEDDAAILIGQRDRAREFLRVFLVVPSDPRTQPNGEAMARRELGHSIEPLVDRIGAHTAGDFGQRLEVQVDPFRWDLGIGVKWCDARTEVGTVRDTGKACVSVGTRRRVG